MLELVEKLPSKVGDKVKSTYEQLIEEGRLQGIVQGIVQGIEQGRREKEIDKLNTAIKFISLNIEIANIAETTNISKNILYQLHKIYVVKKAAKAVRLNLAKQLIKDFKYLTDNDIANFVKLKQEVIEKLRNQNEEEKSSQKD